MKVVSPSWAPLPAARVGITRSEPGDLRDLLMDRSLGLTSRIVQEVGEQVGMDLAQNALTRDLPGPLRASLSNLKPMGRQ